MIKNYKGFFGWQGNNLAPVHWVNYVVVILGLIILSLIFVFRRKLKTRWSRKTKYLFFFNKEQTMWKFVGYLGLVISIARISIMWIEGYSPYWEGLGLHLCRLLIILLFIFLAFGKVEWTKHLIYFGIIGFLFATVFIDEESDVINGIANGKLTSTGATFETIRVLDANKMSVETTQLDKLMILDHMTFFHAGFDNFFLYDVYLSHLLLLLIPSYIFFSKGYKMSIVRLYKTQLIYITVGVLLWIVNWTTSYSPDPHWRANFWFLGTKEVNSMDNVFGVFSQWPQNVISAIIISTIIITGIHAIYTFSDKFIFFEDGKFVQKVKSENWKEIKNEYKQLGFKGIFKEVFTFKRIKNKHSL